MLKCILLNSIILPLILFSTRVVAQSDFDLSQRWLNESIYNPAATASNFTTGVFMHGRTQWASLEGAPTTQVVGFDTYIDHLNSGIGLIITGDQIGLSTAYSGKLSYAYNVPISKTSFLSLGLSAGLRSRNLNAHDALMDDLDDPSIYKGTVSDMSPDFAVGVEFKSPIRIGFAIQHLGAQSNNYKMAAPASNLWAYASSRINRQSFSLEPSFAVMHRTNITRYEAGVISYFGKTNSKNASHDQLWIGGMFRFHGQYAILAGVALGPKIRVGYSFDYGVGDLARISNYGTHELFLSWQFERIFYRDVSCPAYKTSDKNVYKRLKW